MNRCGPFDFSYACTLVTSTVFDAQPLDLVQPMASVTPSNWVDTTPPKVMAALLTEMMSSYVVAYFPGLAISITAIEYNTWDSPWVKDWSRYNTRHS